MLYLYDKALTDKFKQVMPEQTVVYAPVDKFYERYLLGNDNKPIKLPAVSVWRSGLSVNQASLPSHLRIGNVRYPDYENYVAEQFYSVNVEVDYQVDVWTANDIDRDDMIKEMLYFLILYPYLSIEFKGRKFTFPLVLGDISDATDISNFENGGDIYRFTIPLKVPDARIMYFGEADMLKYIDVSYVVNGQDDGKLS